jgi:hypothetical protein
MTTKRLQLQRIALVSGGIWAGMASVAWGQPVTPAAGAPSVKLSNSLLTLASWSDSIIVANTPPALAAASYLLTVNNSMIAGFVAALDPRFETNMLLGNLYGGDGDSPFAIPDLRGVAPNGLTYTICTLGVFPSEG